MKRRRTHIILTISVFLIVCGAWLLSPVSNEVDLGSNQYFIAHAAGEIDGHKYTNCREALLKSLDHGFSYIEIDLQPLDSTHLVAAHDMTEYKKMTGCADSVKIVSYKDFLRLRIYGRYTPLTLDNVLEIRKYRPFTLVTDKIDDPALLDRYFSNDKSRLIVESFSWQRYAELRKHGYTTVMAMYKKSVLHYLYYCLRCKERIACITSSAHSYSDIIKLRLLKRLFGVKIFFVPIQHPAEHYIDYIGHEFDMVYCEEKLTIQNKR